MLIDPSLFALFLTAAVSTILSPGPAVLMTISNSMQVGFVRAFPGILGVSVGTLCVAGITATGLGVLIATTPFLYAVIKALGVPYLAYLGWRKWTAKPLPIAKLVASGIQIDQKRIFIEGVLQAFVNPGLIVFYLSLMPQCINTSLPYASQFATLAITYAVLVIFLHSCYGICSSIAAHKLLNDKAAIWVNRVAAIFYWLLCLMVAWLTIEPFL